MAAGPRNFNWETNSSHSNADNELKYQFKISIAYTLELKLFLFLASEIPFKVICRSWQTLVWRLETK